MKRLLQLLALSVGGFLSGCASSEEPLPDNIERLLTFAEDSTFPQDERAEAVKFLIAAGNPRCLPRLRRLLPKSNGLLTIAILDALGKMPSRSSLPCLRSYNNDVQLFGVPPDRLNTMIHWAIQMCESSNDE